MANVSLCLNVKCQRRGELHDDILSVLKGILPSQHQYLVCTCTLQGRATHQSDPPGFEAKISVNLKCKDDVLQWKQDFEHASRTTWRVRKTVPSTGDRVLYCVEYRCQHNTYSRTDSADARLASKNTKCPAALCVTVYNTNLKRSLSLVKDVHLKDFTASITMRFCHNHPINAADALKHCDVAAPTRQKIEELLLSAYRPAAALSLFKYDMQAEDPENYLFKSADRAQCPDIQYVYRLYYKLFLERYGGGISGSKGSQDQVSALRSFVDSINEEHFKQVAPSPTLAAEDIKQPVDIVRMAVTDDNQVVIAMCTPMMKRVHEQIKHSGEMFFCDASGNMDRYQCRVFVLLTHSAAGGLPVGILIVTSESQNTIRSALELYMSMMDSSAFYGRGKRGPLVFMTDDSKAERGALHDVYPEAVLLLCSFHVLQAFWQFLWDTKHGVPRGDRQHLFFLMKGMLYADTEEDLDTKFESTCRDGLVLKHPKILHYLTEMFARREEWAVCCRKDIPIRNNNTNNFCESAMKVLKEQVLNRTKAFNVLQLVDFVHNRLESHYQRRLLDVANNRLQALQQTRFCPKTQVQPTMVRLSQNHFTVTSLSDPNTDYTVDTSAGFCSCPMGFTGGPCKHQEAVVKAYKLTSWNMLPVHDPKMRQLLQFVATGQNVAIQTGWFRSLKVEFEPEEVQQEERSGCDDREAASTVIGRDNDGEAAETTQDNQPVSATQEENTPALSEPEDNPDVQLLSEFDAMMQSIRSKYSNDPATFQSSMETMLKSFKKIDTDSHLMSAMNCFGKYTGVALQSTTNKRKLVSNKDIGIQPAAKQRRVVAGCKNRARLGRPPKSTEDSSKGVQGPLSAVSLPRQRAKHALKECVKINCSLGKNHSAK